MPKIKSASEIAGKWSRVTPMREDDFRAGVESPKADWASQTIAAKEAYKAGIQEALNKDRFARGVAKAGTEKWKSKTLSLGVARWGAGVSVAAPEYEAGFKPYADVIASTNLPPRYAKGDPRNIERVKVMAAALRAKKVGA